MEGKEPKKIRIRDIRAENINELVQLEGRIRASSDVRPKVTEAKFECPSCKSILVVKQEDEIFKEPSECQCNFNGEFKLTSKNLIDTQRLVIEEILSPEENKNEEARRLVIFLKEGLCSLDKEEITRKDSKIRITGILTDIPRVLENGNILTKFDIILEADKIEKI